MISKHLQIVSLKTAYTFIQGQPFRLTDVDLHEVINILNIIVSFS